MSRPSRASPRQNAQSTRSQMRARMQHHQAMAGDSLLRLWRAPLSSLMTLTVIGIALLLPALLSLVMKNVSNLGGEIEDISQITLYLREDIPVSRVSDIRDALIGATVREVRYISSAEALEEFRVRSGLENVIAALDSNPLPASLVVYPATIDPAATGQLLEELSALPEVESAQLDLQWLQRLQGLMDILERAVAALILIFSVAVLFVVGNTIRMAIEGRRAEILVVKLVGGSNSFVARPFLYTGFWYGLFGGFFAWVSLLALSLLFAAPLSRLLALYGSDAVLQGPGLATGVVLLAGGALLGWLGAVLSVMQHLAAIEPR